MKEDWENKKLGEIATFVNGYAFKPSEWVQSGKPIIRIQNLTDNKAPYNYFNRNIDAKYKIKKGDVLISWSATLGVFEWDSDTEAWLNQHIFKVLFDKISIEKQYFKYAVSSRLNEMKRKVHGITMQHITKKEFDKTLVPVPPIEEQKRIVEELDLLSGVIEKQKQQLKELDTLAQSIFIDMFGDPVTNEKGWEKDKIENVGQIISGSTPSTLDESNWDGDINWVTPAELGEKMYVGDTQRKITEKAASKLTLMPVGTVLLSSRAPIGKLAITTELMCCNQGFKNIICGPKLNNIFLFYLLFESIDDIQALGRGATFKEVSKKELAGYKIMIPPLPLQNLFASKIEEIEKQKECITKSIEETQKLVDYTMDKYFG